METRTFYYIDPWGDILTSVAWAIRALYHSKSDASPAQLVFVRNMIFDLTSVIDWHVIHARGKKH